MATAGGGIDVSGVTLTFNQAAMSSLPIDDALTSSTIYRPTNHGLAGDLPEPAPTGPYGGSLAAFTGADPNGTWRLYAYDTFPSDGGRIADGWRLDVVAVTTDTVILTDTLPAGLTGVTITSPGGWQCNNAAGSVTCDASYLAADTPIAFTIQATAPITAGVITNTAGVIATVADPTPVSNTTSITTLVTFATDLSVSKARLSPAEVTVGDTITYTLTITNPSSTGLRWS